MSTNCRCMNCIMPPHILNKLLESETADVRRAALSSLLTTSRLRGERGIRAAMFAAPPGAARRSIYDCRSVTFLPKAALERSEGAAPSLDETTNRAYDGLGMTRDFWGKVFGRNSVDAHGMRLDGYVHYGVRYNNAFWDGQQMVFGDGDGIVFTDFTQSLDVIAHELAHGITEFTANLEYHGQSGALNESVSDVFGSLAKQWSLKQRADQADWLVGSDIFTPEVEADALRSLKAPGTAYDNKLLGRDPQPGHMNHFVALPDSEDGDWGGVHINSGIPNHAFYLAATNIGGAAWERPGRIWYESLLASNPQTQFADFAATTFAKAGQHFGINEQRAVADAWNAVGIRIPGASAVMSPRQRITVPVNAARKPVPVPGNGNGHGTGNGSGTLVLHADLVAIAGQADGLAKELAALVASI